MEEIGIRELRQHASRWLARVAAGESFVVTDRGSPVASLCPIGRSRYDELVAAGALVPARSGRPPAPSGPVSSLLTDVLADERSDQR